MDGFLKSTIIRFGVNSSFYNKAVFRSRYICGYFNNDQGEGKV